MLAERIAYHESRSVPLELAPEERARIARRADEILNEDPAERDARVRRMLAERIAYHELQAEKRARRSTGKA